MTVRVDRLAAAAPVGYSLATEVADWLVRKGVPFREAHEITGKLVALCVGPRVRPRRGLRRGPGRGVSAHLDPSVRDVLVGALGAGRPDHARLHRARPGRRPAARRQDRVEGWRESLARRALPPGRRPKITALSTCCRPRPPTQQVFKNRVELLATAPVAEVPLTARWLLGGRLGANGVTDPPDRGGGVRRRRGPGIPCLPGTDASQRGDVRPGGLRLRLLHLRHALVPQRGVWPARATRRQSCCARVRCTEGVELARDRRPAAGTDRDLARGPARLAAALGAGRHRRRHLPCGRQWSGAASPRSGSLDPAQILAALGSVVHEGIAQGPAVLGRRRPDRQPVPPVHPRDAGPTVGDARLVGTIARSRRAWIDPRDV